MVNAMMRLSQQEAEAIIKSLPVDEDTKALLCFQIEDRQELMVRLMKALALCAHPEDGWPHVKIADIFEEARALVGVNRDLNPPEEAVSVARDNSILSWSNQRDAKTGGSLGLEAFLQRTIDQCRYEGLASIKVNVWFASAMLWLRELAIVQRQVEELRSLQVEVAELRQRDERRNLELKDLRASPVGTSGFRIHMAEEAPRELRPGVVEFVPQQPPPAPESDVIELDELMIIDGDGEGESLKNYLARKLVPLAVVRR